jgi:hypothetical protein
VGLTLIETHQLLAYADVNLLGYNIDTNYLHGAKHYSRGHQLLSHSIVSQHFMEPEGSIPKSQELSTCSYLSQTNPVHITHPTSSRSILMLSTHLPTHQHRYYKEKI